MPTEKDQNGNDEIKDDDKTRLLDLYNNATSNFQKSFSILLGFALIFVFVFLLPYVSSLEKSYSIDHRLATLAGNINKHSQNILYLESARNGLQNLSSELTKFPSELDKSFINLKIVQISQDSGNFMTKVNTFFSQPRTQDDLNMFSKILSNLAQRVNSLTNSSTQIGDKFDTCNSVNTSLRNYCNVIEKINRQVEGFVNTYRIKYGTQNSSYRFPTCDTEFHFGTNEWASCNLGEKIRLELEQFNQILLQNVSHQLSLIDNNSQLLGLQKLQKGINDLKNHSYETGKKTFSMNESNSPTLGGGLAQLEKLTNDIHKFQQAYNNTIEPSRVKFDSEIKQLVEQHNFESRNLTLTKMSLLEDRQRSVSDRNKLEYRLNQTQFPFGKLPINLDESIAAFPVALAIGFLVSASYLANSIQLRKELHSWYRVKYKDSDKSLLDQRISLIAPLWVDPSNSKATRIMKFTIFLIPFFTFILSAVLIFYYIVFRQDNQILASLFSYGSFSNPLTYAGLYLVCAGFFIYGTLNTLREIRSYSRL